MRKQSGFAALEVLLILIIAGLLGFVGWYVWHSKSQTDKTFSNTQSTSNITSQKSNARKPSSSSILTLSDKKVTLSYDSSMWQIAQDWKTTTSCGQSVLSSAKCLDYAVLVLKKDGEVNKDQFQVDIGVFAKSDNKNVTDWFKDDVDAVDGLVTTSSNLATTPRQIYAQMSDYSKAGPMEEASDEIRLAYGITSQNHGVLIRTVLFKTEHYSFKTSNDYHQYQPNVETIVKSIRITD